MATRKKKRAKKAKARSPHAYPGLDRVLHEKARLGIVVALLGRQDGVLFPELKELCELTDGNLSRHLSMLHENGIVEIWKKQEGGRSSTLVRLSKAGREQLLTYLDELESVLRDARESRVRESAAGDDLGPGWSPA